jgi:hypothetical protein
MNCFTGPLPRHFYVWVDSALIYKQPQGFVPAAWFALSSYPSRAWGLTVMLECGAVYRNLPPHAISFIEGDEQEPWSIYQAQRWNCYGYEWHANEYPFLRGLSCAAKANNEVVKGQYLFSVAPIGDGYSAAPDQSKEFKFIKCDNGRLTIQPTDRVLFHDDSFTDRVVQWPSNLKVQNEIWETEL